MENVSECVKSSINVSDKYTISVLDITNAVLHLKKGKTDGHEGLYSDNIINATHSLFVMLTLIYNTILVHGLSPDSMILGTMVPCPKNKRQSMADSNNYRAITLSRIIGKMLDWVILLKESVSLGISDHQFGFKQGVSTTQYSFVMLETISHYNYNVSNIKVLLLDATKGPSIIVNIMLSVQNIHFLRPPSPPKCTCQHFLLVPILHVCLC